MMKLEDMTLMNRKCWRDSLRWGMKMASMKARMRGKMMPMGMMKDRTSLSKLDIPPLDSWKMMDRKTVAHRNCSSLGRQHYSLEIRMCCNWAHHKP